MTAFLGLALAHATHECPDGWEASNATADKCFRVTSEKANFADCAALCQVEDAQGSLVCIGSPAENDEVQRLLSVQPPGWSWSGLAHAEDRDAPTCANGGDARNVSVWRYAMSEALGPATCGALASAVLSEFTSITADGVEHLEDEIFALKARLQQIALRAGACAASAPLERSLARLSSAPVEAPPPTD